MYVCGVFLFFIFILIFIFIFIVIFILLLFPHTYISQNTPHTYISQNTPHTYTCISYRGAPPPGPPKATHEKYEESLSITSMKRKFFIGVVSGLYHISSHIIMSYSHIMSYRCRTVDQINAAVVFVVLCLRTKGKHSRSLHVLIVPPSLVAEVRCTRSYHHDGRQAQCDVSLDIGCGL